MKLDYTKFFGILTVVLGIVYYIGTTIEENENVFWLIPQEWIIYGIIISAAVTIYCYIRRL